MKKILMIGPSPNRIGGVSIHIHRLVALLNGDYCFDYIDEARGINPGYFNLRSLNIFRYVSKIRKADVVHIHSGVFILRLVHIIVAKIILRKNVVVSIHHDLNVEGHLKITRSLLKHCNYAILDSQGIYDSVFLKESVCNYKMMPAFLPPIEKDEECLPDNILSWIKKVRNDPNSILMCSSSYSIGDYNGFDLYGNDMSIDAVRVLNDKNTGKTFYLLMIVHNSDRNPDKLKKYKDMIANGLSQNIMLVTTPISFLRVMKASDVILRPTNTDGDSLTIREALYFKKRVVASDCVERPKGTRVFKTRDVEDFCSKIQESVFSENELDITEIDYKSFYINCYNNGHV